MENTIFSKVSPTISLRFRVWKDGWFRVLGKEWWILEQIGFKSQRIYMYIIKMVWEVGKRLCLFFWQPQCWSQSVFGWNDFIVLSWNQGNFSLQTQKVEGSLLEGTGNMLEQRRWLQRSSEGAAFMYITSQYLQRGAAYGGSCIGIYYIIILSKYVVLLTYTQYIVQILYTYTCTCSHCLMLRLFLTDTAWVSCWRIHCPPSWRSAE